MITSLTALALLSGCSSLECPPGTRELHGNCVSVEDPDDTGGEDGYLTVDDGYALLGYREQDYAGVSLDAGGDFNGDGIPDIVVGAMGEYQYDYRAGEAYVVLGPVTGDRLLRDAHLVMGDNDLDDWTGVHTRFAGDLDEDGFDDLVVSAVHPGQGSGHAYIVHGPTSGSMDLETEALQLSGMSADDVAGRAVAGGHDLDGDGVIDLAITAPGDDVGGDYYGTVFVVSGTVDEGGALDEVASASLIASDPGGKEGYILESPGDMDGDGIADLAVGASYHYLDESGVFGRVAIVPGPITGAGSFDDVDDWLYSGKHDEYAEPLNSVRAAGDVNGDGQMDLLVSDSSYNDPGSTSVGIVYVVEGPVDGLVDMDLYAAARIKGGEELLELGKHDDGTDGAGDLDGDGLDDVIIGAMGASYAGTFTDTAFVFHAPLEGTMSTSDAEIEVRGVEYNSQTGHAVTGVGDITGDLLPDLVISASGATGESDYSGVVYVLPGG